MASDGKSDYEEALDLTGFGSYNVGMLLSNCFLILAMYLDIFGFSVVLPAIACDMKLSTSQQGLLSSMPLIGVMLSSYAWGICADTKGRRWTLLLAMPIGIVLNLAASLAPTVTVLAVLKCLSAGFTSSANAAGFVLLGETTPARHRSRFMYLMVTATMLVQLIICACALPIFQMTFSFEIPWLLIEYRPWRLLLGVITIPGILGVLIMICLHESPKFLLSKNRDEEALNVLGFMHSSNGGEHFEVKALLQDNTPQELNSDISIFRRMWKQTVPLFKPPLLKYNLLLYYLLLCAYMTSTGYTMWVPTMVNAYFNNSQLSLESSGQSFCEVASGASAKISVSTDCHDIIQPLTLYAVMCYSGASGILTILLSCIVGPFGKKKTTLLVFVVAVAAGIALLFVKIPVLSIAMFYVFLYVALILGNANAYLVDLNPTHLRGMATCLSVIVARGFGFISVQLIGLLLTNHCIPMIGGYLALITSGLLASCFLPPDKKKKKKCEMHCKNHVIVEKFNSCGKKSVNYYVQ